MRRWDGGAAVLDSILNMFGIRPLAIKRQSRKQVGEVFSEEQVSSIWPSLA